MDLTQRARDFFVQDIYATRITGVVIASVTEFETICTLQLTEDHRNAAGGVMGGVLFTLADFAFAVAANTPLLEQGESNYWISLNSTIHYLAPTNGEQLTARTTCIKSGKSVCLYNIDIFDEHKMIATIQTTGTKPHRNSTNSK